MNILTSQEILQHEAAELIKTTPLLELLSSLGAPTQTGSSVTGLMVYPDIDFAVQHAAPNFDDAVRLVPILVSKLSARSVKIADFGNGYYLGLDFPFRKRTWHIDATVGLPGPIISDPPELNEWIKAMTPEQRLTILNLKKKLIDDGRYVGSRSTPPFTFRSSHLYEGVLVGGATTITELEAYFKKEK